MYIGKEEKEINVIPIEFPQPQPQSVPQIPQAPQVPQPTFPDP